MIVRLTHAQQAVIFNRFPQEYADAIRGYRLHAGHRSHDVLLPAIAWRNIAEHLREVGFGPMGGKTQARPAFYHLLTRVQRALNRLDTHPALRVNGAIIGISPEVIPAWLTTPDHRLTPYPATGRFVILRPHVELRNGHTLTRWVQSEPNPRSRQPEGVLEQESFHLRFSIGVDAR